MDHAFRTVQAWPETLTVQGVLQTVVFVPEMDFRSAVDDTESGNGDVFEFASADQPAMRIAFCFFAVAIRITGRL